MLVYDTHVHTEESVAVSNHVQLPFQISFEHIIMSAYLDVHMILIRAL